MFFSIFTFGCRVNSAESESLSLKLQEKGWQSTSLEKAEVVIINSCAVTQKAEREVKQLIYQLQKKNPQAKIYVIGCAASLWLKDKMEFKNVVLISNQDKQRLVSILLENFSNITVKFFGSPGYCTVPGYAQNKPFDNAQDKQSSDLFLVDKFLDSGRLMLKAQDGCDYFCTYCVVPYTRGRSVSYKPQEIINTYKYVKQYKAVKEIILTGINLGLYGVEWGIELADLVKIVLDETDVPLISFGSLYVENLTEKFFALWHNPNYQKRLTSNFHVPMQSASDKILRIMNRHYTLAQFDKKIVALKKAIPEAVITTDIIVGYLGETEKEFEESYCYFQKSVIQKAHVFRFSNRKIAASFIMAKKYPEPTSKEKKERAKKIRELFNNKKA